MRQLFTVSPTATKKATTAAPAVPSGPVAAPTEDEDAGDVVDAPSDAPPGAKPGSNKKVQQPIPIIPQKDSYDLSRDGTAAAFANFGDNQLENIDYCIDHPVLKGRKLWFSADPTHLLKCTYTSVGCVTTQPLS